MTTEWKCTIGTYSYSVDHRAASSIKIVTCNKTLSYVLEHIVIDFKGIEHEGELC